MALITEIFLIVIVAWLTYYFIKGRKGEAQNLPPGPKGLPVIGSLLSLSFPLHTLLGEWSKQYGNIMRLKVVNYGIVMISDAQTAREAFNNPLLSGRPFFPLFDMVSQGVHGVLNSSGHTWTEQRRFALRKLRDFGFGKSSGRELYMQEVKEFIGWMKNHQRESVPLNRKFSLAAVNSLWMIMTGKKFKQDDTGLIEFMEEQNKLFNKLSKNPLVVFWPEIAQQFPNVTRWNKMASLVDQFSAMMREPITEHEKDVDFDAPRDFVDAYLKEIHETKDSSSVFFGDVGKKNLEVTMGDLFGAGSETTAQTMSFAIMYLCKNLGLQKKLQAELDSVVGKGNEVSLDDRQNLPYTEAVIWETLRKSSIAPFALFHAALETTKLGGFTIPKKSWVAINLHYIHHNPDVWGDPQNFRPERFLSEDGKTLVKNDNLIPFSVGKRVCVGEQLARDGLFLFLSNIFNKFDIRFDPKCPEPSMDGEAALFINCDVYNVVFEERV